MRTTRFWLEVPRLRKHWPAIWSSSRASTQISWRSLQTVGASDFPRDGIDLVHEILVKSRERPRHGAGNGTRISSADGSWLPWPPSQGLQNQEVVSRGGIPLSVDQDLINWLRRRLPVDHTPEGEAATREARKLIQDGFSQAQPFRTAWALLLASREPAILQRLPATLMFELFHICTPEALLEGFQEVITEDVPYDGARRKFHAGLALAKVVADVRTSLHTIFGQWRDSSHQYSLLDFRLLLDWARAFGDGEAALALFDCMIAAGITPDTQCYNYYFEARCWHNRHDLAEQRALRVVPVALQRRRVEVPQEVREAPLQGYRAGGGGLKQEIVTRFESMVRSGVPTDVTTYSMLILAMGREGDLAGVKAVLKQVWNIDVDLILSDDGADAHFASHVLPDSPLYPDSNLLHTLAHVFGANNDIHATLQLVDFMSRRFAVAIDLRTWKELLEWTFVLSSRASKSRKDHGGTLGKISMANFHELWDTMTSAPYHVTPTMGMHGYRFRAFARQGMLPEALQMMHDLRPPIEREPSFAAMLSRDIFGTFDLPVTNFLLFTAHGRAYVRRRLRDTRNFVLFSHWFSLLLSKAWRLKPPAQSAWRRRGIPSLVAELWPYRPRAGIDYTSDSGLIAFTRWNQAAVAFAVVGALRPGLSVVQSVRPLGVVVREDGTEGVLSSTSGLPAPVDAVRRRSMVGK